MGDEIDWETSQRVMKEILDDHGLQYIEASGEAAFYGPKLDVQIKNVYGKEDTLVTVQLDFLLAKRFEMTYTDRDSSKKYPYVIHRSSIGCYERTLALLLEKTRGDLPLWLSPEQIRVLPVSEKVLDYCKEIEAKTKKHKIRITIDDRNEKIGYKIRQAQIEKIPYMAIVGEKELKNKTVSLRNRKGEDLGEILIEDLNKKIKDEITKFF